MIWLIVLAVIVLAVWIAAGIDDARAHRAATTTPHRHRRTNGDSR